MALQFTVRCHSRLLVMTATLMCVQSIAMRVVAHDVQEPVKMGTMLLEYGPDPRPSPEEQAHPLAVVTPLVGPSTFSTLPGVTAANINDKVTCTEPSNRS